MEKKKLIKRLVLAAATLLVACGFIFGPRLLAKNEKTEEEITEAPVFSVRAFEAAQQTLRAFLDINGDIVSTQQVEVFPDVAGKLTAVRVNLGSYVYRGQIIAEVDPRRPGAEFLNSPIYAPISGTISRTPLAAGSTVSPLSSVTAISANGGSIEINAWIPEREIAGVTVGLKAEVSLQAYPGEKFSATVNRVSPIVDSNSRTKLINLRFDRADNRINPGMFARIRINSRTYPDVLTIPSEAVVKVRGADTVYVVEHDDQGQPVAKRREVETGVTLQGWTEIKAGLEAGETVIVQGQQLLSGGERLRIIGDTSSVDAPSGDGSLGIAISGITMGGN